MVKNLPANAANVGSVPGSGRYPGEGRNLMDRAYRATYGPCGCKRVRHDLVNNNKGISHYLW